MRVKREKNGIIVIIIKKMIDWIVEIVCKERGGEQKREFWFL